MLMLRMKRLLLRWASPKGLQALIKSTSFYWSQPGLEQDLKDMGGSGRE